MPPAKPAVAPRDIPPFATPYAPPDEVIAAGLLAAAGRPPRPKRASMPAPRALIEAIRASVGGLGGVEDFLHAYALSTKEGLALMVLAEALLRVPDADTADRLIEDKLKAGDWARHDRSTALAGVGLGLDARHHGARHSSGRDAGRHRRHAGQAARPAGGARRDPPGDAAARLAFRARPDHRGGAGARARRTANFFIPSTCWARARAPAPTPRAISNLTPTPSRRSARQRATPRCRQRPGISVKLSALHPRYEALSRERVLKELVPKLIELARLAKSARSQFHRRRRRGRPAGIVARRRSPRRLRDPSLAGLGRLRPRGAGLSEARRLR